MNFNEYYEALEPVFYLERLGYAESNTWIGASQTLDTIFAGRQSRDGDEFHLLAGGDFLVRDGKATSITFWHPKHIFEKSYGGRNSSKELFGSLAKIGVTRMISAPQTGVDYAAGRSETKYPKNHARLTYEDHSPTFDTFRALGEVIRGMADHNGLHARFYDFHEERRALLQVSRGEGTARRLLLEIKARENGDIYVRPNEAAVDAAGFVEAVKHLPSVDPAYTHATSFWARGMDLLENDDFIGEIENRIMTGPTAAHAL